MSSSETRAVTSELGNRTKIKGNQCLVAKLPRLVCGGVTWPEAGHAHWEEDAIGAVHWETEIGQALFMAENSNAQARKHRSQSFLPQSDYVTAALMASMTESPNSNSQLHATMLEYLRERTTYRTAKRNRDLVTLLEVTAVYHQTPKDRVRDASCFPRW